MFDIMQAVSFERFENYIVKTVTDLNSNVSANVLTIDLTSNTNQSNVRHDSQDINWINSVSITKMNTNLNKAISKPLKRKKILDSESIQKSNIGRKHGCIPKWSYQVTEDIWMVNFKKYFDPNLKLDVLLSKMPKPNVVPRYIIKTDLNDVFLFTIFFIEDVSFNTPEITWFTNDGISHSMSFYPNQIMFLSPTIKEKNVSIKMLIHNDIPVDFSPA
jgi:hypothetical protein